MLIDFLKRLSFRLVKFGLDEGSYFLPKVYVLEIDCQAESTAHLGVGAKVDPVKVEFLRFTEHLGARDSYSVDVYVRLAIV